MEGYLGETIVDVKDTPYKDYSSFDWDDDWGFEYDYDEGVAP